MKCYICGKEFTPRNSWQKYCSCHCQISTGVERRKARRKAGKQSPPEKVIVLCDESNYPVRRLNGENICMWCGNGTSAAKERFCSSKCLASFYNRLFDKF